MPFFRLLSAACLLVGVQGASGNTDITDAELARQATEAFQKGVQFRNEKDRAVPHFREAALCFDELRQRGATSPALYLDLGNAQLLSGDVAGAIVSYRRGLRLDPLNEALRVALDAGRAQVNYPVEGAIGKQPARQPSAFPEVTSNRTLTVSFIAYISACVLVTRSRMNRRGNLFVVGVLFLILALTTTAWGVVVFQREADARTVKCVVIKKENEVLRKGGGWLSEGEPAFPARHSTPLPIGVEARLLIERADWVQVELTGGEIGWVPTAAVIVV